MSLAQKLIDIKNEIEESTKERNVIKGRLETLMETLKEEWELNSIDEAKKEIEKYNKYIKKIEEEIDSIVDELDESGWDI